MTLARSKASFLNLLGPQVDGGPEVLADRHAHVPLGGIYLLIMREPFLATVFEFVDCFDCRRGRGRLGHWQQGCWGELKSNFTSRSLS